MSRAHQYAANVRRLPIASALFEQFGQQLVGLGAGHLVRTDAGPDEPPDRTAIGHVALMLTHLRQTKSDECAPGLVCADRNCEEGVVEVEQIARVPVGYVAVVRGMSPPTVTNLSSAGGLCSATQRESPWRIAKLALGASLNRVGERVSMRAAERGYSLRSRARTS
jgi:hypothetical protein